MKLISVINAYIELQQSMGLRSETAKRTLRQFGRQMGDIQIGEVQAQQVLLFLRGSGSPSSTWRVKYRLLSGLYRFAISRGHVKESPLPQGLPKFPPQQTPYIYSTEELHRLLDATSGLDSIYSRQQAPMFRTLILLLYGSGMRISEALGLTMRDVDLVQRVITVRNAKFYKTRLVSIGPKLALELTGHADRRRRLPMPSGEDSSFFTSRTGTAWTYHRVITLFQRVRRAACIECPPGELRPPRLHDLRHYVPFLIISGDTIERPRQFEDYWFRRRGASHSNDIVFPVRQGPRTGLPAGSASLVCRVLGRLARASHISSVDSRA